MKLRVLFDMTRTSFQSFVSLIESTVLVSGIGKVTQSQLDRLQCLLCGIFCVTDLKFGHNWKLFTRAFYHGAKFMNFASRIPPFFLNKFFSMAKLSISKQKSAPSSILSRLSLFFSSRSFLPFR